MKKKLGILSLLALTVLVPSACSKNKGEDLNNGDVTDVMQENKSKAINELYDYLEDQLALYGVEDTDLKISAGLESYKTLINDAVSQVHIDNAVANGKSYIDKQVVALHTALLAKTKESAIKQLEDYVDIRLDEEKILITSAIVSARTNGESKINSATTVKGVEDALKNAKDNIDILIEEIKNQDSKNEFNNLLATKLNDLDNYVSDELTKNNLTSSVELQGVVATEKVKISETTTITELNSAYDSAIIEIDKVIDKMIEEKVSADQLEAKKESAKAEINTYATSEQEKNGINEAAILLIASNYIANVDTCTTTSMVDEVVAQAKSAIDAKINEILNNNAQAELAQYKNEKKEYIGEKAASSLTQASVTDDGRVADLIDEYKSIIDIQTSKANVDSKVLEFEGSLDTIVADLVAKKNEKDALNQAKEEAKLEIEEYAAVVLANAGLLNDQASVETVNVKVVSIQANIDGKTTVNEVEAELTNGKASIDSLIQNLLNMSEAEKLQAAKDDAKLMLETYSATLIAENGITDDGSVATALINAKTLVDNVTAINEISGAISEGEDLIDTAVNAIIEANAAKALADAKTSAITEITAYATNAISTNGITDDGSVVTIVNGAAARINACTSINDVNTIKNTIKTEIDSAIDAIIEANATKALADAKAAAISEISTYGATEIVDNSITDDGTIIAIVDGASSRINICTSISDVNTVKNTIKAEIDNAVSALVTVKELANAKSSAITEISNYAQAEITENNVTDDGSVAAIVSGSSARINACTSINDVNSLKETIKSEIDVAVTLLLNNKEAENALAEAKANAVEALKSYAITAISSAGITDDGSVVGARDSGITAINAATSDQEITAALENAKDAVNAAIASLNAAELQAYITAKKSELQTYANNQVALYGVTDDGSVSAAVQAGNTSINIATSKTNVDAALIAAKANVDAAISNILNGKEETPSNPSDEELEGDVVTQGEIKVIKSSGWLESAYVEFEKYNDSDSYNVYYKKAGSGYRKIDDMLVRDYGSYVRADAIGLAAGDYTLKVAAVKNGVEDAMSVTTISLSVAAHDRSGYAFVNGTSSGAYNEDGTLRNNAVVLYVTDANKDSISTTVAGSSVSGLGAIVAEWKDETRPLCVRLIGNVGDSSSLDKGDLLIDGATSGITIEGVGNDATANGWGIRVKNADNVEIRNIGLMNCDSSEGDNVGLQQGNTHCWVHNNDFFYGDAGSDADQAKGDGALDTKKSQYVTHSYNHFWDSGKTHLNGNGDTTLNYITYHHNWYDHSDSRHPLVRCSSAVHVYNNLYDGVSKYGMISRIGASIFSEANYFKDTQKPMLISQQGTDMANGTPIASDDGGIIKSYGNYYDNTQTPITHKDSATDFDVYEAASRTETVSSSYKTLKGGNTYSNFDTSSGFYEYKVEDAQTAKATTEKYAGRVEGGDFDWDFSDPAEDKNYAVITELKSALVSYKSKMVKSYGSTYVVINDGSVVEEQVSADDFIEAVNAIGNVTYTNSCLAKINNAYSIYQVLDDTSSVASYYATLQQKKAEYDELAEAAAKIEVDNVISLINSIGTVTSSSGTAINSARLAYNALSSAQQANVTNYSVLVAAEAAFEQYAVQNVIDLITSLSDASTATNKDQINSLLEAYKSVEQVYNNLSSTQKTQVTNYSKLSNGINTLEDALAPYTVIDLINQIPTTITIDAGEVITSAREAYDALTTNQQALVTNYSVLVAAEAAYEEIASQQQVLTFNTGAKGDNSFFTVTGNLKSSIAAKTYNGVTYTTALKLETSTSITFTTTKTQTITLITDTAAIKVKINGTSYTTDSDGVITLEVAAGNISVTKDNSCNLYAIIVG